MKVNLKYILLLIFIFGAIGISLPYSRPYFLPCTAFTLCIGAFYLLSVYKFNKYNIKIYASVFAFGFLVELLGVKSKLIFGVYTYGNALGIKCFDIPLVIGINWLLTSIMAFLAINHFRFSRKASILGAALLMVFYDCLIEPIAHKLDFWYWEHNTIPLQNFIAWFILGCLIQWFIHFYIPKVDEKRSIYYLVLSTLFFTILNFTL